MKKAIVMGTWLICSSIMVANTIGNIAKIEIKSMKKEELLEELEELEEELEELGE